MRDQLAKTKISSESTSQSTNSNAISNKGLGKKKPSTSQQKFDDTKS